MAVYLPDMKAIILLGTLKKQEQSHTQILCEFLSKRMKKKQVECEIIRLVDHTISTGTYSDMGKDDEWPKILKKIETARIIIFATPIWWVDTLRKCNESSNDWMKSTMNC